MIRTIILPLFVSLSIISRQQDKKEFYNKMLHAAARRGDINKVREALAQGADIDSLESCLGMKQSALHDATVRNHQQIVALLINKGANVNIQGSFKITPLHEAARRGNYKIVALLLKGKANVNVHKNFQFTPLHEVAERGDIICIQLLLDAKADPNAKNAIDEETPLSLAVSNGHLMAMVLLLTPDNINQRRGLEQETVLHLAAKKGHAKIVECLLKLKANTTVENDSNETALELACNNGKKQIIEVFVCSGIELSERDLASIKKTLGLKDGDLTLAILSNKTENIEAIVKGQEENKQCKRDKLDMTPLMWATVKGNAEIVKQLLKLGKHTQGKHPEDSLPNSILSFVGLKDKEAEVADILKTNSRGENILTLAKKQANPELVKCIYDQLRPFRVSVVQCIMDSPGKVMPQVILFLISEYIYGGND